MYFEMSSVKCQEVFNSSITKQGTIVVDCRPVLFTDLKLVMRKKGNEKK